MGADSLEDCERSYLQGAGMVLRGLARKDRRLKANNTSWGPCPPNSLKFQYGLYRSEQAHKSMVRTRVSQSLRTGEAGLTEVTVCLEGWRSNRTESIYNSAFPGKHSNTRRPLSGCWWHSVPEIRDKIKIYEQFLKMKKLNCSGGWVQV